MSTINLTLGRRRARLLALAIFFGPPLVTVVFGPLGGLPPVLEAVFYACLLAVVIIAYPAPVSLRARLLVICWLLVACLSYYALWPAVHGIDAHRYYQVASSESLSSLWQLFLADVGAYQSNISFFYSAYPLLVRLYLGAAVEQQPALVVFFNLTFVVMGAFAWVNALRKTNACGHWAGRRLYGFVFFAYLCTINTLYWTNSFNKDAIIFALCTLCAYALVQRRYLMAFIWLIPATMLRPYAIAIIFSYIVFLKFDVIRAGWASLAAYTFAVLVAGLSAALAVNIFVFAVYFFLSPNPFDPTNWVFTLDPEATMIFLPALFSLEGVIAGFGLVIGILMFAIKHEARSVYARLAAAVLIGASVLGLLGHVHAGHMGWSYGILTQGANILRKKTSFLPLMVTWVVLAFGMLTSDLRRTRVRESKCGLHAIRRHLAV